MLSVRAREFLPSTHGLHLPNAFPPQPAIRIPIPGAQALGLGNAGNGLCGGMAFAARDYFEAGMRPPADSSPPVGGSPLFEYLVGRLLTSFNLPSGPVRYLGLMSPWLADGDTWASRHGLRPAARSRVMIEYEWPRIRRELDRSHPSALGLIKVRSADPRDLGKNHQVLAYGYDLDGTDLLLRVYDPNFPNRDDRSLSLDLADPGGPVQVVYASGEPVYCFFHTPYSAPAVALPR